VKFDFSPDQQAVKDAARDFLSASYPPRKVRALAESGEYDESLWTEICKLGWPGIFIAEEHGGHGLGIVELTILTEELGYALAPTPFFSNAAAGLIIQAAGSDEQKRRWLPGIASGAARGAVTSGGNGAGRLAADADGAALVIVVEGDGAAVVEAAAVTLQPAETMDSTRRFSSVSVRGGERLAGPVAAGTDRVAVALAGELVGIAQRAMEMAVEYAKQRSQFGRAIGSYQAVSHRCAQMLLEVESARSATYAAAWAADAAPEDLPLAASIAKAYASDAGWRVAASSVQVHGGIGFTWEHDLHFWLKRARVDGYLFGTAAEHRERVAKYAL
jgi:alkylation response protein AidB-like acyl-CoA dehydrogenase